MRLNFAYPATGQQKSFEIEDEKRLRFLHDKRMAQEVALDPLGDEWKGYIVRIGGGNDKQGFPMKQGVLTNGRVRLLLKKGQSCYRPRKTGERKRKSVRGCIVDANLSALNLVIVKKGDDDVEGLTDQVQPRRLGPKRASRIRKLFNLSKEDDVTKYVITHERKKEGKPTRVVAPKIQRLVTPTVIARRKAQLRKKRNQRIKSREEAAAYHKLLNKYAKEQHDLKIARRRSSASHTCEESADTEKYISLNQTLVVFDVEQPRNAQQTLTMRRLPGVGPIAWRFQTNAPTRYIVYPNSGVMSDDDAVQVVITLVDNRYSPQHKLQIHAKQYTGKQSLDAMWKEPNGTQIIHLDLGTTLMNLDHAACMSDEAGSKTDIRQILSLSSTVGQERIKELEEIYAMAEQDNATLANNVDQSNKLKEVLVTQLSSKKEYAADLRKALSILESKYMRKSAEVDRLGAELANLRTHRTVRVENTSNCVIS
ncbi:unnamed protein product [Caenorhabditis auriculariae]|uniref:Major sperm protein n=1 Tax=Caenorhabditis auriculariae TaxID=2777116 RepID=A0A8S1HS70_9PELO|nr:unnamed protein product [Caenorhabditis auriculariae]